MVMRFVRWRHHAILSHAIGIDYLTESIVMDQLAPLLRQINLTAQSFHSGELCQLVAFDENAGYIHILKSGKVTMSVRNGPSHYIEKPSVIFFPRTCPHSLVPDGDNAELLCAYVDLGAKVGSPLALSLPEAIILPMDEMGLIKPTLELLFSEAAHENFGRQAALDRLIEYFLIQMLRHVIAMGQLNGGIFAALADARLKHAVTAMHERPGHPWTLDELADIAGMSRGRFAVNFRETVGVTPLDYLTNWRMSVAQNMLKIGRPIKSVAAAVGYQSQAALARVFAKRVGQAPTEWLRGVEVA
jgi:AraC-like DNA-binding protein